MWVVEVDPGEEGRILLLLEPAQGLVHDLVAGLLDRAEVELLIFLQIERIVVVPEPLVQAPAPVEDEGRDESPGTVPPSREDLGQGRLLLADGGVPVDPDAVIGRVHPRHDRGVRGKGQGRGRGALLEEDAAAGQGIQRGRLDPGIAVAGQAVGPCRVQGDDDDVGLVHALLPPPALEPGPGRLPRAEDKEEQGRARDHGGGESVEKDFLLHRDPKN
jgi:hypothetical protein